MSDRVLLDETALRAWTELVGNGVTNAISGLSEMLGQNMSIANLNARVIQLKDAADLLGGPEAPAAAIYLSVYDHADGHNGDNGHMVLVYRPEIAFELIDLLLDEPAGTTHDLGEMEASVLGEMGNIVGSFFLNHLSDAMDIDLRVSPPHVMMDMAGAVLDAVLAEIMLEVDEALIMETVFGTADRQVSGTFLCLPSPSLRAVFLEQWSRS